MIRLVQRRLIVPRGDTGTFSIPILAGKDSGDAAIFTVFDPLMHRKIFEKAMTLSDGALGVDFTHNDTVNLPVGQYVWDIKFYTDPLFVDGKLVGGTEVDSYYSAFTLPICEIRETGDNLLMSDDAPTGALRPGQVDIITASIREITSLKESAAESAANADTSATNAESSASAAATSAQDALDSKVAALAAQQTASAASENAASAAANAQASATLAAQRADQVMVELGTKANIEDLAAVAFSGFYSDLSGVPTRVSQFINDAGYLTQHQDISGKANLADLATVAISGSYEDLNNKPTIPDVQINGRSIVNNGIANIPIASGSLAGVIKTNLYAGVRTSTYDNLTLEIVKAEDNIVKSGTNSYKPIVPGNQHIAAFYGLAKAAGDSTQSISTNAVGTYTNAAKEAIQTMLDVPSKADVPTKVSDLTDDSGHYTKPAGGIPASDLAETYLIQHQDISMKANSADLATVATSGSYEDLSNKPTIPDVQINGTSIVDNGIANIPIASSNTLGVIRILNDRGLQISSSNPFNGVMTIQKANSEQIKNGSNQFSPIVPYNQHEATFYGLALAAGDLSQVRSDIPIGTYTADAKTAIQSMLDVPSNATVTSAISTAIGNIHQFDIQVVQALPTQDIQEHTVYFVPKTGETNDVYDEYIYVNNGWEMIGNTQIDLSNYATKSEIPEVPVQDVQVNGVSVLQNGVANMPIASTDAPGAIRLRTQAFSIASSTGLLDIRYATSNDAKGGANVWRPITTSIQHDSTFYGLAKAAGDTTQSVSTNAVGTYTAAAKEAIQQMLDVPSKSEVQNLISISTTAPQGEDAKIWIDTDDSTTVQVPTVAEMNLALAGKANVGDIPEVPVQDVQINGSSILSSGTANIPIASDSNVGVVKTNVNHGIGISNNVNYLGELVLNNASSTDIKTGTNMWKPLTPMHQHESVFYGLATAAGDTTQKVSTNAVGTYTADAKAAIQNMLGVGDINQIAIIPGTGEYSARTRDILFYGNTFTQIASGLGAFAEGVNTIASGNGAHAQGQETIASGYCSHSEGSFSQANGYYSHAEGTHTIVNTSYSHVEGDSTIANGATSHVFGRYNIADEYDNIRWPEWVANTEYNIGDKVKVTTINNDTTTIKGYICKIANSDNSFTSRNWIVQNDRMNYIEIAGNGTADNTRNNAYALEWSGTGRYAGDVYVNCNNDSTGGTRLATVTEVAAKLDAAEAGLKVVRLI